MTLGERRALFTRLSAELLLRMRAAGFTPRLGEVARPGIAALLYGYSASECDRISALVAAEFPALAAEVTKIRDVLGAKRSVHLDALAADVVLFRNGTLLGKTEDHEAFGVWWEAQHELCRWGGRFGDGGHYSVTPDGVRK